MKNVRENLKKTVLAIMVAMITLNVRSYRTYAEEEPTDEPVMEEALNLAEESEEIVDMSVATETENMNTDEADTPVEEYKLLVEETFKELPGVIEEIVQEEEEISVIEEEAEEASEEAEVVSWKSYTLYNYISVNEGKSYISLNTQENGISVPKSAAEFHKENGNKRYDLSVSEYDIADYDLTQLVYTAGGLTFVEKSVAKEGQPYFVARLDRVEAVAAANFRASSCVEGIESFKSLDNSNITFHRNWYLTLVTPMTSNKLLTGVRLGDGKNGIGDGKYYGIEFTENFQAIDSRLIPFGTKLKADQYSIENYDFTNLKIEYKGETYAYRPNGPVAGDGEAFHYYTVSLMKIDKLNKPTYAGGYLVENWPAWSLINSNAAGKDGYPYQEGYYHRDYQATLMVADAPLVIEEDLIEEEAKDEINVENVVEVSEETVTEKIVPVVEEEMIIKEPTDEIKEENAIETSEEETVIEGIVEEDNVTVENSAKENAPVQEAVIYAPAVTESINTNVPDIFNIKDEVVPQAEVTETVEVLVPETVVPQASPSVAEETRSWALINLICILLSALGMIFAINRKEEYDENEEKRNNSFSKLLGIIPVILSIPFFLLTEDMNYTMVLTDKYTLMMMIFPLVSLLTVWLARNKKEENEDNKTDLIESPVA